MQGEKMARTALLTLGFVSFIASTSQTLRPYIEKQNLTCFECPAGFYLSGPCTSNNTIAVCTVCPRDTYSSIPGVHTSCARCSPFCESLNLIVVSNCSSTKNLTCDCPPGKVLTNPHDKHRSECEDPPTQEPPKTKQNCSDEAEEDYNVPLYNQTEADLGSGIFEDVGCINFTNCTCPVHDKCVDSTNGIPLVDRLLLSLVVLGILIIVCVYLKRNTQCCDMMKNTLRCKGSSQTSTDGVPDPVNEEMLKDFNDHLVEIDNTSNDEQNRTDDSELMTSDPAHAFDDESLHQNPTSTVPPSIILPSATGTVEMETFRL